MKKTYLPTIILFVLGIACWVVYTIIGAHLAPDGTLIEPFGLIIIAWLCIFAGIISSIILLFHHFLKKK